MIADSGLGGVDEVGVVAEFFVVARTNLGKENGLSSGLTFHVISVLPHAGVELLSQVMRGWPVTDLLVDDGAGSA